MLSEQVEKVLNQSAIGSAILAEQRARDEQQRKRLAERRAALEVARGRKLPGLRAAAEKAKHEADALRAQLREAERRAAEAEGAVFSASIDYDQQIDRIDAQLRELSDPRIADCISTCQRELEVTRQALRGSVMPGRLNIITMRRPEVAFSNAAAVNTRVAALRAAIARAEEMRTTAGVDLEKELTAIRSTIPPASTLSEFVEVAA